MATSGSYDWSLTASGIINDALEDLGVIVAGGTPSTAMQTAALTKLNLITKDLSARGIRIWSVDWVQKTFSAPSEVTGTDGNIYTCILGHTGAASNRPITGANYTTYWVEAGSSGGTWATSAYTSTGDFDADAQTINILSAFIREGSGDSQLGIGTISDYFKLADKTVDGKPSSLFFDKLVTPHIYLYPQPDFSAYANYVLHYLRESMLEDFDAVANDPDISSLFINYLVCALRYEMSFKAKKTAQEMSILKTEKTTAFNILRKKEAPKTSRGISPSFEMGYRQFGSRRTPQGSSDVSIDSP